MEINGRTFSIILSLSKNRNAWARLRGDRIAISIPSRWPVSERKRSAEDLLKRAVRSIEKGRWKPGNNSKIELSHGQMVHALGRRFAIRFVPSDAFGSRVSKDGVVEIRVEERHPDKAKLASAHAKRRIVEAVMPELEERVKTLNERHFQASLGKISMRDNTSRWGSCSPRNDISLSFRLLMLPNEILDYVIVHELAHTRYRSHGPRFWGLVEKAIPDHKERRRWLREKGWQTQTKKEGQQRISDFFEC
ncbi:MAG: M48 family metallopeptidase [Candidatus Micrarchaeota archaeon]